METAGEPRNILLDASPNMLHRFDAAFTKLLWPLLVVVAAAPTATGVVV